MNTVEGYLKKAKPNFIEGATLLETTKPGVIGLIQRATRIPSRPQSFRAIGATLFGVGPLAGVSLLLSGDFGKGVYCLYIKHPSHSVIIRSVRELKVFYRNADLDLYPEAPPPIGDVEFNGVFGGHPDGGILFTSTGKNRHER